MRVCFWILSLIFSLLCFSCKPSSESSQEDSSMVVNTIPQDRLSGGASGMTQIDSTTFVGIYDIKSFADGPRVVVMKTIEDQPLEIIPILIEDWNDPEGKPSDLESICRIGDEGNQFLMAEAGTWQGGYGRIFHLTIDTSDFSGKVLGIAKLPFKYDNDFDAVGDQYEGMACIPLNEQSVILLLAERGGSEHFPLGILRWGILDLNSYSMTFSVEGMEGITIDAPGHWLDPSKKRDITALHIDDQDRIWASASQDLGDSGPFYSVIYQLGHLTRNSPSPIDVNEDLEIWREISGFKIEALSGPSALVPNSRLSFATEDESFGGNWRAIE